MKRTRLRKVSKKKASEQAIYRKLKNDALAPGPLCEFPSLNGYDSGCVNRATQIHHAKGRQGELLNDQRYWWMLCMEHHRYVHDHPNQARKMGLILY